MLLSGVVVFKYKGFEYEVCGNTHVKREPHCAKELTFVYCSIEHLWHVVYRAFRQINKSQKAIYTSSFSVPVCLVDTSTLAL